MSGLGAGRGLLTSQLGYGKEEKGERTGLLTLNPPQGKAPTT